jgi:hypothetical protein
MLALGLEIPTAKRHQDALAGSVCPGTIHSPTFCIQHIYTTRRLTRRSIHPHQVIIKATPLCSIRCCPHDIPVYPACQLILVIIDSAPHYRCY